MKRFRRVGAATASLATIAGTAMLVMGPTAPAFAGTPGSVTYELDCTTSLSAGTVAPFAVTTTLTGAPDGSFPTNGAFGAGGAYTVTLVGPFIAGLEQQGVVTAAGVGANVINAVLGNNDGSATGTYTYNHSFAQVPQTAAASTSSVSWPTGTAGQNQLLTLSGNFPAGLLGLGVSDGALATAFPTGAAVVAETAGTSVTIRYSSASAVATQSGQTVSFWGAQSFTDPTVNTGAVFHTNGTNGGTADIGLLQQDEVAVVAALTIPFGGAAGVGASNCLETGYDSAETPGPAQAGATGPAFPPPSQGGPGTALKSVTSGPDVQTGSTAISPPTAAFVTLNDPAPTANNGAANLGVGQSKVVALSTTDADATPTTACNLVGSPSDARLNVVISNSPTPCQATITDSGSGPAVVTFQFSATDGVTTGNTATETVNIGTPPVDEPLTSTVNAGQLVLSCVSPDTTLTPQLLCNTFDLGSITLNGLQQTVTNTGQTLYVSDNRGDPTVGWTLTASMVATSPSLNTNSSCTGLADFCNASVSTHATNSNGQISASRLAISNIACNPHSGNLNAAATAGAGGNFSSTQTICTTAVGESGGTFDVTKSYTLTIPSSVYAGTYWGTVEYLVS